MQDAVFVMRRSAVQQRPGRVVATHEHAVLGFYVGGRARVEQRGSWVLEAGDALLIPAGERHRLSEVDGAELWGMGFCAPCLAADGPAELLAPFERVRAGASPVVRIAEERRELLERLFGELAGARERSAAVQRSLLVLILDEVARAAGSGTAPGAGDVVARSLAVIERRCLGALTLEEVAREVGRSPSYVTTALRRATGRSAGAWIVAGRIAEARRRLLHSDERIEDVAANVGYADVTHFIRMFRRAEGATPAAWRAAQAVTAARLPARARR